MVGSRCEGLACLELSGRGDEEWEGQWEGGLEALIRTSGYVLRMVGSRWTVRREGAV